MTLWRPGSSSRAAYWRTCLLYTSIRGQVAAVSAGIVEDQALLDLCYEEDSSAQVDLNCVMDGEGRIIELQGTGEGRPFTIEEQRRLVDLCAQGVASLQAMQREVLGGRKK